MITLTRSDRDALATLVAGGRVAVARRYGAGRLQALAALLRGGGRRRAVELVDLFDGLAARPVREFPPSGVRPGRVLYTARAHTPADQPSKEHTRWQ